MNEKLKIFGGQVKNFKKNLKKVIETKKKKKKLIDDILAGK